MLRSLVPSPTWYGRLARAESLVAMRVVPAPTPRQPGEEKPSLVCAKPPFVSCRKRSSVASWRASESAKSRCVDCADEPASGGGSSLAPGSGSPHPGCATKSIAIPTAAKRCARDIIPILIFPSSAAARCPPAPGQHTGYPRPATTDHWD